jgi:hypothetical protein
MQCGRPGSLPFVTELLEQLLEQLLERLEKPGPGHADLVLAAHTDLPTDQAAWSPLPWV